MDQLSGRPTSFYFTVPSMTKFHPAQSVRCTDDIVIEVNILQLDALP